MFFLLLIKQSVLKKNFSKHSSFDGSGISLLALPSRTNLKPHSIQVTTTLVNKIITNLDLSKVPNSVNIPMVVLETCEPEHTS